LSNCSNDSVQNSTIIAQEQKTSNALENYDNWHEEFGSGYDQVVKINFSDSESTHLITYIELDFYLGGLIEIEAILDTGSSVSFLNTSILKKYAPHLLQHLMPCPVRFSGIAGQVFQSAGFIPLSCKIEGKYIHKHNFV